MAKIGGEPSAVPEFKIDKNILKHQQQESRKPDVRRKGRAVDRFVNKSIKPEDLIKAAAKKNPAVNVLLNALKQFIPGLNIAAFSLDPSVSRAPVQSNPETTEAVAEFLFKNGGRWPDEGPHSFQEGARGDKEAILNLYQAMVEQAALEQMAESDMKTQEKYQLYDPDERKSFEDKRVNFLKNL